MRLHAQMAWGRPHGEQARCLSELAWLHIPRTRGRALATGGRVGHVGCARRTRARRPGRSGRQRDPEATSAAVAATEPLRRGGHRMRQDDTVAAAQSVPSHWTRPEGRGAAQGWGAAVWARKPRKLRDPLAVPRRGRLGGVAALRLSTETFQTSAMSIHVTGWRCLSRPVDCGVASVREV